MQPTLPFPLERRQAIFAELVQVQDDGIPVPMSRKLVASRFGITISDVESIEREGLMRTWPPLA